MNTNKIDEKMSDSTQQVGSEKSKADLRRERKAIQVC